MRARYYLLWTLLAVAGCREPATPSSATVPSHAKPEHVFVERQTLDDGPLTGVRGAAASELVALEVYIPGGQMNGTALDNYYLDVTETTISAYSECVAGGVCSPAKDRTWARECITGDEGRLPDLPVNCVSRAQAIAYCEWVGKRLPTGDELKWEAKGGEENRFYPWGGSRPNCTHGNFGVIDDSGYDKWCGKGVESVGSYPSGASIHGVLDLEGNVSEWVSDIGYKSFWTGGISYATMIAFDRGYSIFSHWSDEPAPTVGIRCARDAD